MQRFLRFLFFVLVGLFLAVFFYCLRSVFVPFGIAAFLTYLIYPLVRSLEERGVPRIKAILTVYAAGVVLTGLFLSLFIPALFREAKSFGKILPAYTENWNQIQGVCEHLFERAFLPEEVRQVLRETLGRVRNNLLLGMRRFVEGILGLISLFPSFLLAPFLSYYLLRDLDYLKKRFLAALPPGCRSEVVFFLREADLIFSNFLHGHLLISSIVGVLTGLGAAIIGLPFSIIIGLFTAVADLIPIFGPVVAAIPVVGFALADSKLKGILMLGVYLLAQQIESSVLVPRLMGERIGLHPLVVVFVLFAGGYLFGPLGVILAVPFAGVIRLVARFIWSKLV